MQIRLRMSHLDLLQIRFALSPLFEIQSLVRRLTRGSRMPSWFNAPPLELDSSARRAIIALLAPRTGPAFLAPMPVALFQGIDDEVSRIRNVDPGLAQTEIGRCLRSQPRPVDPSVQSLLQSEDAVAILTDAIQDLWTQYLEPHWSTVSAICEQDVIRRSIDLARHGAGHVLAQLDGIAAMDDEVRVSAGVDTTVPSDDAGLILIPSLFLQDSPAVQLSNPRAIIYRPHGHENGPDHQQLNRHVALSSLLGRTRALLLQQISAPTSTHLMATTLGVSKSATNEHLQILTRAGLARKQRAGHSILYSRTPLGDQLVGE